MAPRVEAHVDGFQGAGERCEVAVERRDCCDTGGGAVRGACRDTCELGTDLGRDPGSGVGEAGQRCS